MPKKRRATRSSRVSPYPRRSILPKKSEAHLQEWEEARCPICMEHPHNAVLMKCSNYNKGCRPYICNTSDLHSNCSHRFYKSFEQQQNQVCPLCRGRFSKWVDNKPARKFMNSKARNCSCEGCEFVGNFDELAAHAEADHPLARPAEVDPARQLDWAQMQEEWEREHLESFQFDGFGDYLIGITITQTESGVEMNLRLPIVPERHNEIAGTNQSNLQQHIVPERRNVITRSDQEPDIMLNPIPQIVPERHEQVSTGRYNLRPRGGPERHQESERIVRPRTRSETERSSRREIESERNNRELDGILEEIETGGGIFLQANGPWTWTLMDNGEYECVGEFGFSNF